MKVLGAARAYAPGLLAPWYVPSVRFVIVTIGRTGSELLSQSLDSHPEIVCDGEIMNRLPRYPRLQVAAAAARARAKGAKVHGWKLLVGQLRELRGIDSQQYIPQLAERGTKVILLERNDPLQIAISWYRAFNDTFHHRKGEEVRFEPCAIDPQLLLWATEENAAAADWLRAAIGNAPRLSLVYETDLLDPADRAATIERVCRYLSVEPELTSCDLVKVAPRRTREMVSNWDEVVDVFRGTRFAHLVEPERM